MDRAGRWRRRQPTGQTSVNILAPSGCRCGQDASGSLWCPLMTTPYQQYPPGVSDKSKVVAGILQILLGGFGAGRFYIGDTKTAVIQLVVTIVTCGFGAVWGLVDGILLLVNGGVDGQGRPLRD
ncbi:NINE protein [Micromonospora humi]